MIHKLIVAVISVALWLPAYGQIFNPDRPMIKEFTIPLDSANIIFNKYSKLKYSCEHDMHIAGEGWVEIPNTYYVHNGKSLGIILTHDAAYGYHAHDARCAHCFYDNEEPNGKMIMWTRLSAKCSICSAIADNIVCWGSGQLTAYDHGVEGPKCLDPYVVDVTKKGKKVYLTIRNAPNGARDQWMELPENQILLK